MCGLSISIDNRVLYILIYPPHRGNMTLLKLVPHKYPDFEYNKIRGNQLYELYGMKFQNRTE